MSTVDEFIQTVYDGSACLTGKLMLSGESLRKAKRIISNLQIVVDNNERLSASQFVLREDGTIEADQMTPETAVLEISAEGIELTAGDRLTSVLKRVRNSKGQTMRETAEALGLDEDIYRPLELGVNWKLPDDVLQKLSDYTGESFDDVKRMCELDRDNPVRAYPY